MARRGKRRIWQRRKVSFLKPLLIIIFGLILIAGSFWIYKIFSEKKVARPPEVKVGIKTTREINLYFATSDAKKLVVEKREILEQPNLIKGVREVVEELIRGPRHKDLVRTFSPQTKIRSLYVDFNEGITYVDFTENIVKYSPGGSASEILSIYSIVNSIIDNFPEIKQVKILINGEEAQTLAGHIDLTHPIGFSQEIIKSK